MGACFVAFDAPSNLVFLTMLPHALLTSTTINDFRSAMQSPLFLVSFLVIGVEGNMRGLKMPSFDSLKSACSETSGLVLFTYLETHLLSGKSH